VLGARHIIFIEVRKKSSAGRLRWEGARRIGDIKKPLDYWGWAVGDTAAHRALLHSHKRELCGAGLGTASLCRAEDYCGVFEKAGVGRSGKPACMCRRIAQY
jgi:hypothetical protein